jgi:hypothetical protein
MKRILISAAAAAAFAVSLAQPVASQDLASQIVGVWKYTSQNIKEVETGKIDHPYGQNPTGLIVYTKGGHVVFALAGDNRKVPASPAFTDAERIALFNTMAGASGTYKVEGNTLTVTYTTSWNQTWTGVTQKRQIEIVGNKLTVTSAPVKSTQTGKDIVFTVTYERVE